MFLSSIRPSDSVTDPSVYLPSVLFQVLFYYRSLQNIKCSSLCYAVGGCWLHIHLIFELTVSVKPESNSFSPEKLAFSSILIFCGGDSFKVYDAVYQVIYFYFLIY